MAQTPTPAPIIDDLYYESPYNGFRVALPDGWAIEDRDTAVDPLGTDFESSFGFATLATICPEDAALPGIGGTHQCQGELAQYPTISIIRFPELKSKSEFASVLRQNKTIVPLDILPLHLQAIKTGASFGGSEMTFSIGEGQQDSTANMTVHVSEINPQTNQAVAKGSVPAEFVEVNYRMTSGDSTSSSSNPFSLTPEVYNAKMFALYVVSEDGNTGYAVSSSRWPPTTPAPPPEIREIIDSFGLVRSPS